MLTSRINIPTHQVAEFCRRNHILKFALFGSVLREDFGPQSDVDVMVEFEEGHIPGFAFAGMERELTDLIGRKVDLRTPEDFGAESRTHIAGSSLVQYVAS